MPDLRGQLEDCFQGRACLVGVGNVERGDDGLGVRLAEALAPEFETRNSKLETDTPPDAAGVTAGCADSDFEFRASLESRVSSFAPGVILAGTTPERSISRIANAAFNHVIFLDAVEFGGAPGSVVWLDAAEMASRFPQISTHRISLGTLAQWIEAKGTARAWLLGVQPASLRPGSQLTPAVRATLEVLVELFNSLAKRGTGMSREPADKNICAAAFKAAAAANDAPTPVQSTGHRQPAIA